jgi:hypothetical protein
VVAGGVGVPPFELSRATQVKPVAELLDIGPQCLESANERADAVAFLDAQLGRTRDVQLAAMSGPGCQRGNLIYEIRDFICP